MFDHDGRRSGATGEKSWLFAGWGWHRLDEYDDYEDRELNMIIFKGNSNWFGNEIIFLLKYKRNQVMNRRSNVFSFPCWSLTCMDTLIWGYSCILLYLWPLATCKYEKSTIFRTLRLHKYNKVNIYIPGCQSTIWGFYEHNARILESIIPWFRKHNPPEPTNKLVKLVSYTML